MCRKYTCLVGLLAALLTLLGYLHRRRLGGGPPWLRRLETEKFNCQSIQVCFNKQKWWGTVKRDFFLPSRTTLLFCRDTKIPRVAPRVSLTFLRGLSSSLSPFSNCLAILPGSMDLTCCPTSFPTSFCYLSPWSVVLLIPLLELPGYFAGILLPHVLPHVF
jgi:hypothetical protein